MASGFPTTFEKKDQSPLNPMSAASGPNTPISYKANVNRNKTSKWANAKPVDYGGDDWGDEDEFDPPPPPVSKPTGLRQQGQGLQSGPPSASSPTNKKNYGELPPLHGAALPGSVRPRLNSFHTDDERRSFSNATARQPSADTTTTPTSVPRSSQSTATPTAREPSGPPALSIAKQQLPQQEVISGLRKGSQVLSPASGSTHPEILLPGSGRANTGVSSPTTINPMASGSAHSQPVDLRTPSGDYQARRDFSSTAVPASSSSARSGQQNAIETPTRFPARDSSRSRSTDPDLAHNTAAQETSVPKPWTGGRPSSPGASTRSPATPSGKALPFIRPADIYRRMEEEREKERQSVDSGRPSMDSLVGAAKSSDRSESPAKPTLREKTSSDSLGSNRQRVGDDTSGRHQQPILESVKERRSEYGFESFKVDNRAASAAEPTERAQLPREYTPLDIEHPRSSSVSPKLPDLHRMSGFGNDLFPQPKFDQSEPPLPLREEAPSAASNLTSAPLGDKSVGRQRSLGSERVVSQAFDREVDPSVPPTPASRTGSGVRRTDNEATGTTGTSPIMSRAPSGAVSDIRGRDGVPPSMLEVLHEPVSPIDSEKVATDEPNHAYGLAYQSGYRREIRNPISESIPASNQDLAQPEIITQRHEKAFTDSSSPYATNSLDRKEPPHPPRPFAEREESFRPSLPGGWTSFATTARSETPQQDSIRVSAEVGRAQAPANQYASASEQYDQGDDEGTPTTVRQPLPQIARGAAAGATMADETGAALRGDDQSGPRSEASVVDRGDNGKPKPGPAIVPSGNINLSEPLDPRRLPKPEGVSPEAQLRPALVQTQEDFNDAPIPPAKDTPYSDDVEDFLKPTVPLKQRTLDQIAAADGLEPPKRPKVLPTLSTETRPQDEESDKLRKEILKSLSPKSTDAAPLSESLQPDQLDDHTKSNDGRFSYLPKEYDNYWATTSRDAEPASISNSDEQVAQNAQQPEGPAQGESVTDFATVTPKTRPNPPLSSQRTSVANDFRPSIPHRFSWENSAEDVSLAQTGSAAPELPFTSSDQHLSSTQTSGVPARPVDEQISAQSTKQPTKPFPEHEDSDYHTRMGMQDLKSPTSPNDLAQERYSQYGNVNYDKGSEAQGLTSHNSDSFDDGHSGRDTALLVGGASVGGGASAAAAAAAAVHPQPAQSPYQTLLPQRRLSLAEEKDPQVSSYPVSPTPPEDDHPARSPQAHSLGPFPEQPVLSAALGSVTPINASTKTQMSPTARILAFKEIAAIKAPQQRIQTFDEMRQRFATMDSGLLDWMSKLKGQHPEHANVTGSWSGAAFLAPSKATGQQVPPVQQPYYQQYLNASPTASGTPVSKAGPSTPSGSQQGISAAGGKLTSHQVQAKGKELLHSAGIFSGKAGKAGKGLLAKGKNKLRGSGAGDKTSPTLSPSTKPKNDRRTSWSLPLTVSRSSGRPDASVRESKEIDHMPIASPEGQRAENTSESGEPEDERDFLRIPAPISKNGPSWDPFNATPTAEEEEVEEGLQYEDCQTQQTQARHSPTSQETRGVAEVTAQKNERSNSEGGHFSDALEEPLELNDWVLVSSEPETKETQPEAKYAQPNESVGRPLSIYRSPEEPPPGLSERQQTRAPVSARMSRAEDQAITGTLDQQVQHRAEPISNPESEVYEPPEGPPPGFLGQQQRHPIPQSKTSKASVQPSKTSVKAQVEPERNAWSTSQDVRHQTPDQQHIQDASETDVSQPSPKLVTSVLNRPRFSYEASAHSYATSPTQGDHGVASYSPTQHNFVHYAREQQSQPDETQEPARNGSFEGLPPIRRTSTFGVGFGRHSQPRFPLDDDEEFASLQSQNEAAAHSFEAEIGAAAEGTIAAYASQHEAIEQPQHRIHHTAASSTNLAQQRGEFLNQTPSSDYGQRSVKSPTEPQSDFQAPRAADAPPEGFRVSQDSWRPSAASRLTQITPIKYSGPAMVTLPRTSVEQQRSTAARGVSEFNHSTINPDVHNNDRGPPRSVQSPPLRPMLYDQPPSSAQRYPELFQTQQQPLADLARDGELPAHMYQAPIPREAAFLPRQQTNEYQLHGVGPPADEPRADRPRRNSGFLKDLGGRIARSTSSERGNSISSDKDQEGDMSSTARPVISRDDYPESSVASDEDHERQQQRSGFFGTLSRASTTGLGPPQSRESVVAHFPGSRTDLLTTPRQSPTGTSDRKKSFFGTASSSSQRLKSNKPTRSSISGLSEEPGKKKRFSGLSSMFSRNGNSSSRASAQDRPQATRELSYNERQPIDSPQFEQRQTARDTPLPQIRNQGGRDSSRPRQLISKVSTGGDASGSSQDGKNRRPSASNLLSGIMGRKSDHKDRGKEDSSSQGTIKQASYPSNPQSTPLGQTYSDLREASSQALLAQPSSRIQQPQPKRYDEPTPQPQQTKHELGRRDSRELQRVTPRDPLLEPQYDNVPIPGGYSLVRGQGAIIAPTDYDPRGVRHFQHGRQIDGRVMQQQPVQEPYQEAPPQGQESLSQNPLQQVPHHPLPQARRTSQGVQLPTLAMVKTDMSYNRRPTPRLSREDLLARSPAREQLGQQRPYQLSLPEDEGTSDSRAASVISPLNSVRSPPIHIHPQARKQHEVIQRLQQPVLRHPESPAGYPLPEDAFSPVNEAARDVPPPPAPNWPSQVDTQHGHKVNQYLSTQNMTLVESELDRSNTRRTAMSAVSGISGSQGTDLRIPNKAEDNGRGGITPSPTPPSPAYTPQHQANPPRYSVDEKELERGLSSNHHDRGRTRDGAHDGRGNPQNDQNLRTKAFNPSPSPDLYSASPRLPSPTSPSDMRNDGQMVSSTPTVPAPRIVAQTSGIENANALAKAKSTSVNPRHEGNGIQTRRALNVPVNYAVNSRLNGRDAREEKIYYDAETGQEGQADEENGELTMSATSYPGQEWNPYIGAEAWEDGFD